MSAAVKRQIASRFRARGLDVEPSALKYLAERFADSDNVRREVDEVIGLLKQASLPSGRIRQELLVKLLEGSAGANGAESSRGTSALFDSAPVPAELVVLSAADLPHYAYNEQLRQYTLRSPSDLAYFGTADDKALMFRERYLAIKDRLLRNEQFAPRSDTILSVNHESHAFELTTIDSLLGSPERTVCVLGMIAQFEEGEYYLEDPTGAIPLQLENTELTTGMFTENSFVLAEGGVEDGIFHASGLGLPPAETREETRRAHPRVDFLGTGTSSSSKDDFSRKCEDLVDTEDTMIVVLAELQIDVKQNLERFGRVLDGFEELPRVPSCLVLCGSFTSKPFGQNEQDIPRLEGLFSDLANTIAKRSRIAESTTIVLVPGENDACVGKVIPQHPLPKSLVSKLENKCRKVVLGSNPSRIAFGSKEFVFFRVDLLHRVRANCVKPPNMDETTVLSETLAKTIVEQGHLCPLPLSAAPVAWNRDHALRLAPLPTLLCIPDKCEPYSWSQHECTVVNPGLFGPDGSFISFYAKAPDVQFAQID